MSRYGNFREFYEKELRPDLESIDIRRRETNRKALTVLLITAIAVLTELVLIPGDTDFPKPVPVIITAFAGLVATGIVSKSYRKEYKEKIIARIAGFADEGLEYNPEWFIPMDEFVRSRIFNLSCDKYSGEDHFRGRIGKTDIEFSEVTAKHRSSSGTGKNRSEDYTTIFRGLFIIADFNKHFKTHTVVLPDTAEKLFGKFGQSLQSAASGRGQLIRLEDPRFEKEFCVYGDDQVEARYILTPALMERIMAYRQKWNTRLYLSFLDSRVYIGISMYRNLFEMRPFKPAADYAFLEESLRFLTLTTEVVEDLNLNTRIWTKD
jgi:hypothetical protein